jgi:hypothetical protein
MEIFLGDGRRRSLSSTGQQNSEVETCHKKCINVAHTRGLQEKKAVF